MVRWFFHGVWAGMGIPNLIQISSIAGFAALAMDAGVSLPHALFMTVMIWAIPAQLVMIGAIANGNTLPPTALAVGLSSIRLMPMIVTMIPEVRTPRTRPWVLYLLAHFIAATAWIIGMQRLRTVPPDMRTSFMFGLSTMPLATFIPTIILFYWLASDLPREAKLGLLVLTPFFFLTSMWGSSRETAGKLAMVIGVAVWPLFHHVVPDFSLLATGLVGGGLAFLFHLWQQRRSST